MMTAYINALKDDKFQVITKHESQDLVMPKSYLGIEYSEDIIFIQVTSNEGRTTEMKKSSTNLFVKVWLKSLRSDPRTSLLI